MTYVPLYLSYSLQYIELQYSLLSRKLMQYCCEDMSLSFPIFLLCPNSKDFLSAAIKKAGFWFASKKNYAYTSYVCQKVVLRWNKNVAEPWKVILPLVLLLKHCSRTPKWANEKARSLKDICKSSPKCTLFLPDTHAPEILGSRYNHQCNRYQPRD